MIKISPPMAITLGVNAAFLAFYTGYSKADKAYKPSMIWTVFTLKKGLNHTMVELNKEISLSGLGTLAVAFLPPCKEYRKELLRNSIAMLSAHTVYSTWKYYGGKNIPSLSEWWATSTIGDLMDKKTIVRGVKRASLILGVISQGLLWGDFLKVSPETKNSLICGSAIVTGTAHFYLMELDYKW
eukprot:CAMPEP_0195534968 /NCGR_PEP_ID=MMETSP0794_2-20130614/43401_1 /TAXON_ID=515487 /ORGANISM="Stephanopyxis turris, Strain CCMP 815" /LENGTH=183 /DNA_ID=CAMNT_0040667977 /DNA_START=171 /DNA_END=719 /DNA_ORIENTATION=-